ncbi:MAG: hypothetical protein H7Z20_10440 [Bdellovibrio sp.]|nr:hypothetical protein [Methylotenera sp.]
MRSALCDKIELANGLGVRLLFCESCQVIELEIGAISLKLSPDMIQRVANIMMKASLKLDHVNAADKKPAYKQPQLMH